MDALSLSHVLVFTIILSHITISISSSSSSSSYSHGLTQGSSLFVENKDELLVSPNSLFTAGFHQVGENAYAFAVWFSDRTTPRMARTVVWMANRDAPVNGELSKLSLWEDGNLVLIDAGQYVIWSTQTESTSSSVELRLLNTGNLVLQERGQTQPIWQSFEYPTDILLPNQLLTKNTQLISSTSSTNYSSGYYKLFFDYDSILRLVYNGPETTSIYWPDPRLMTYDAGRFQYIDTRKASLDSYGQFNSSDGLSFVTADYGAGPHRIMKMDTDGNVRVYSLVEHEKRMKWQVQWQAISHSCRIDGACGPNSLCTYTRDSGRNCVCLHGYKMANSRDWIYGCEPEFEFPRCTESNCDFIELRYTEFYGYDIRMINNATIDICKKECLQDANCVGFNFGRRKALITYYCFIKSSLHNGYQNGVYGWMFIKLPKKLVSSYNQKTIYGTNLSCPPPVLIPITRSYEKIHDTEPIKFMLVLGCTIGVIEIICIAVFWICSRNYSSTTDLTYFPAATGFRKFTYNELKKASRNFSEEIGRGGGSVVYKGRLIDNRIAAIKKLKNANEQGEAEFEAEISLIGRVNHMNLIETWGYCSEGKHRLIVYEYMENGSLAGSTGLDWVTRFDIAIGTAKGLAYLHEECLEWVLHCDVKPHNILLDANYNPKVADFGLSKLFDRCGHIDQWNFSMMRGTRGYMAPEWVFNLPITSKVDVFSYGVVILELITGRSPANRSNTINENGEPEPEPGLINWVRDCVREFKGDETESWVEEIIDYSVRGEYDRVVMENLVRIALQCVEEDQEARPLMSQVVNMLMHL